MGMATEGIKEVLDNIPKSARDDRLYRGLILENNMKVLLISDPTTDKAAAAMDVHVGNMSDPEDLPGLAHFCEHMLFLGTEKYPLENAFTQFLSENGGASNAFTGSEHTNFYFDVKPERLEEALDRFAQFFLSPLFNANAKDREVNAVDSEHEKNKNTDIWRFNQLEKSTVDPSHPYSKFGTGNKFTLDTKPKEMNLDVREELLKFHSAFYSSNTMGLAVLGKETLDQLTELIKKLFAHVEDKNISIEEFPDHPYREQHLQVQLQTVPVRDLRNLNLSFPLPDISEHFDSKPSHYVSHLLGHEGEGSLLSELKEKGWANGLVAGAVEGAKGFMFFICNIELTIEGLGHVNEIIKCVFQCLEMLRQQEPREWVYEECRALAELKFNFKDKESPRSLVSSMARSLHEYPLPEIMRGQYLITSFKPDLIRMLLNLLIPSKVRIMIISQEFQGKTDETEKWYGTEYSLERIPASQIQEWSSVTLNAALRLPDKNEFIPTDFEIKGKLQELPSMPKLIKDTPLSKVWFKQDDTFLLPKACLYFEMTSPLAYIDPCHCNMAYLFLELLQDSLNEYAYAAEIAGVTYKLQNTMYGMFLSVKGYNHKQRILLQKILDRMTKFVVDPKRFPLMKERYQRGLKNFKAEQPHQHALYYTSFLMEEVCWHKDELLEALDEVTVDKLQAFIPELLGRLHIESLLQGNVTEEEALNMIEMMEGILKENAGTKPLVPLQLRRHREIQLPPRSSYVFETHNEVHSNSSIEIYYQTELQATRSNMLLELFCQIICEPCFNTLRTQEQLGYIVFSGPRRGNGAQGLRFLIQSEKEPSHVDTRVEAFLVQMEEYVTSMSEEEFNNHVEALAVKRLEKPKKLSSECMRHWGEIVSRQYNFDRDNIEVALLRTLTKEDLVNFFKGLLAADAPKRHKLAVHILPKDIKNEKVCSAVTENETPIPPPAAETGLESSAGVLPPLPSPTRISDVAAFKSSLPLFPLVPPWDTSQSTKSKL